MKASYNLTIAAILVMSLAALLHSSPVESDQDKLLTDTSSDERLIHKKPKTSDDLSNEWLEAYRKKPSSEITFRGIKNFIPSKYRKIKSLFTGNEKIINRQRERIKHRLIGDQNSISWDNIFDKEMADMQFNYAERFPFLFNEENEEFNSRIKSNSWWDSPGNIEPQDLEVQPLPPPTISPPVKAKLRAPKKKATNDQPLPPYNPFMSKNPKTLLEFFNLQNEADIIQMELNNQMGPTVTFSSSDESESELEKKSDLSIVEEKTVNPENLAISLEKPLGAMRKTHNILNKNYLTGIAKDSVMSQQLIDEDSSKARVRNKENVNLKDSTSKVSLVYQKKNPNDYKPLVEKKLPKIVELGRNVKIDLTNYLSYFPEKDTIEFIDETYKMNKMFPDKALSKVLYDPNSYMDRKFPKIRNNPFRGLRTSDFDEFDTPELIADFFTRGKKSCVVITGSGLTGKTTTLIKIHELIHQWNPEMWTTFISLGEYAKKFTTLEHKPKELFKYHFDKSIDNEIFETLLRRNPEKINLLIDDIHKLSKSQIEPFLRYFSKLGQRGAGIIITSLTDLNDYTSSLKNIDFYEIPKLTISDTSEILENIWLKNLPQAEPYLVKDYADLVAKKLIQHANHIPQDFKTLKVIAEAFVPPTEHNMGVFSDYWTAEEYISGKISNRDKLEINLEEIKLDKFKLFKKFIGNYRLTSNENIDMASLYALRSVLKVNTEIAGNPQMADFNVQLNTDPEILDLLEYIKQIHPEYEYYLAANHIITYLEHDDFTPEYMEIFSLIFTNPENMKILEYMNRPDASMHRGLFLHLADSPEQWSRAMDTAMIYGMDHIAAYLLDTTHVKDRSRISSYFNEKLPIYNPLDKKTYSRYSFGVKIETDREMIPHKQAFLFFHNMQLTLNYLYNLHFHDHLPVLIDRATYIYYLEYATKLANPSDEKLMKIACRLVQDMPKISNVQGLFNNLLANVVTYSKINTVRWVEILLDSGAKLEQAFLSGVEGLMQMAASKLDTDLLHFLETKLSISCTSFMPSLLITAFDANPFNQYSPPEFWKTVDFLISRAGNTRIPQPSDPQLQIQFNGPTDTDKKNIVYKLITGTDNIDAATDAIHHFKTSPQVLKELSWSIRNYRKNIILSRVGDNLRNQDPTCLTEIILKYRGLDVLTADEQEAYESSVKRALNNDIERGELTKSQLKRIKQNLMANLGTQEDLKLSKFLSKRLLKNPKFVDFAWDHYWKSRVNHQYNTMDLPAIEMKILPSRNDLSMKLLKKDEIEKIPAEQSNGEEISNENSQLEKLLKINDEFLNPCGNQRRRRRRQSASNCLITNEEYDDIVKVSKQGDKKFFTIDADKFVEKMDESGGEKYEQFKKLGKKLLNKEGTQLNGDSAIIFEEYVHPMKELLIESRGPKDSTNHLNSQIIYPSELTRESSSHRILQAPGNFPVNGPALSLGCGGAFQQSCGRVPNYDINKHKPLTEFPYPQIATIPPIQISPPHFVNTALNNFNSVPKIHLPHPISVQHHVEASRISIPEIVAPKIRFTPRITARG